MELPGIDVQPDRGLVCAFDHVDARMTVWDGKTLVLSCRNPTVFDANVSVFAETAADAVRTLGQAACLR